MDWFGWENLDREPIRFFHEDHEGVSENSVPLNPMVNDHYPY
jgi:hypothetical protein